MNTGTITGFKASFNSGIATLEIDGKPIACENAGTARALASIFPDVIGTGHTVNVDALIGKRINWEYDELDLMLGGLSPVEEGG